MTKEERLQKQQENLIIKKNFDAKFRKGHDCYIAGVDEVGRGPLAGPVCACAVVLPEDFEILGIDDSKKITEKRRNQLYKEILDNCLAYGIGLVDNNVIDEINILEATKLAMKEAVLKANEMLISRTGHGIKHVLFDAITLKDIPFGQTAIVKGDAKSLSIGAASIVAKVTRDNMMVELGQKYPGYAFESNKGYGTKAHYEGIEKQGITPIHRKTFLKQDI